MIESMFFSDYEELSHWADWLTKMKKKQLTDLEFVTVYQ